jgi:hypothetical protein
MCARFWTDGNLADTDYVIPRYVRLGLLVLAGGIFIAAALMPTTHVAAVRVTATAQTVLTDQQCSNGDTVSVSFPWHGKTMNADVSPACGQDLSVGMPVTIYVASNNPSNIGPDANWILNPDTHNPFAAIGPNGLRSFIAWLGLAPLSAALAWYVTAHQARRRAKTAH